MKRTRSRLALVLLLLLAGPLIAAFTGLGSAGGLTGVDWRTASRQSAQIAPDPATTLEPIIQVYAARAYGWRGAFGVHTWIALKPANAPTFTVYQVLGWQVYHGGKAIAVHHDVPDRAWFGNPPVVLADLRGGDLGDENVEALIKKIEAAIATYPWQETYHVWPGPNSNTFTAHIARAVPQLRLDLPVTAIGKDYLGGETFFAPAPSGTGWQACLYGLAGILIAQIEGVEINLLGLSFGIDPAPFALKLPGLGRIGEPSKDLPEG